MTTDLRLKEIINKKLFIGPKYAQFDLVNYCNLKCNFCFIHSPFLKKEFVKGKSWKRQKLNFYLFKKVVDDLIEMQTKDFIFSGPGEPFLHPQMMEMIDYLEKKGADSLYITTNGTLFNKKIIDKLLRYKLKIILAINIGAGSVKGYAKTHAFDKKETFVKLKKDLKLINKLKKKHKKNNLVVELINNIYNENFNDIKNIISFSKQINADNLVFRKTEFLGRFIKDFSLNSAQIEEIKKLFNENPSLFTDLYKTSCKVKETWKCFVGYYFTRIGVDGTVAPCCYGGIALGNLNKQNFETIWKSEAYQNFRNKSINISSKNVLLENCKDCSHYESINLPVYKKLKKYTLNNFLLSESKFFNNLLFSYIWSKQNKKIILLSNHNLKDLLPKVKPVIFVSTNFINKPGYLSWSDLKRLQSQGISIQSSGLSGINLLFQNAREPNKEYRQRIWREIYWSKKTLERKLGKEVEYFYYPAGAYNNLIINMLKKAGYKGAITQEFGLNDKEIDPFKLKSITIEEDDAEEDIKKKLKGVQPEKKLKKYHKVSVVIPTYNRKRLLKPVILSLFKQDYPKNKYEIIVVDDGGTDGTDKMVKQMAKKSSVKLRYFWQEKRGYRAGAARNIGIRNAKNDIVLFIDSDIVAHPELIREHVKIHNNNENVVVIGYAAAHSCKSTYNVDEIISIVNNDYNNIKNVKILPDYREVIYSKCMDDLTEYKDPWITLFSNNVSVSKKALMDVGLFDEQFIGWGVEDIELGYRLYKKGLTYVLNRKAIGYHIGTEEDQLSPMLSPDDEKFKRYARNMKLFYMKFPEKPVKRELVKLNFGLPSKYRLFKDKPYSHVIYLNSGCNNGCSFCKNRIDKHKTTEEIKEKLELIANRGKIVFAGGEPTIRKDIFELVYSARKLGFQKIKIRSNGRMFFYKDFCDHIIKAGCNSFEIYLFGHKPQIHDRVTRVDGSFQQSLRGIRNLLEMGQEIQVSIVLTKKGYKNMNEIRDFLRNNNINNYKFITFDPVRRKVVKVV